MKHSALALGGSILVLCAPLFMPAARGETTAAEEALYRAEALRTLPKNAARRLFAAPTTPAQRPAEAFGAYGRGCVAGAQPLALQGPGWQVMRPSRGHNFGHPKLIAWIEALGAGARQDGWPDLLIGDMAQPRGGPMLTGHSSHQLGLEVDIWLATAPAQRILTMEEREVVPAIDVVQPDLLDVNSSFTPGHLALLRRAALTPEVDRIFVNAAIKQAACRGETGERGWLRKLRPWPGHTEHFHVALKCPHTGCARNPIPAGDGCGKELAHWFREDVRFPKPDTRPQKILALNDLPKACRSVLAAP